MLEQEIKEIRTDLAAMQRIFENNLQMLSMRLADLERKINSAPPTENKIVPASNKK
jgi:phage-related protein